MLLCGPSPVDDEIYYVHEVIIELFNMTRRRVSRKIGAGGRERSPVEFGQVKGW